MSNKRNNSNTQIQLIHTVSNIEKYNIPSSFKSPSKYTDIQDSLQINITRKTRVYLVTCCKSNKIESNIINPKNVIRGKLSGEFYANMK